ncbi:MAG: hypothetical protein HC819_09230 [Cyclobacteriaceae bacterium]|nr:hypothetical protein [Cyclobacteriaceae bacterium]
MGKWGLGSLYIGSDGKRACGIMGWPGAVTFAGFMVHYSAGLCVFRQVNLTSVVSPGYSLAYADPAENQVCISAIWRKHQLTL